MQNFCFVLEQRFRVYALGHAWEWVTVQGGVGGGSPGDGGVGGGRGLAMQCLAALHHAVTSWWHQRVTMVEGSFEFNSKFAYILIT